MKQIPKKILVPSIIGAACLVLTIVLIIVLNACGKIDGIYFETEPRKTYVQGQDFTLENSVLISTSKNKKTTVDNGEATVSGYNKNQIGEQTVTITYEGQTVEIKVTVIPRIALEGITRDYFVGDSFDKSKGRLRVADDQAIIKSVNLSEEAVIIEGFDSSTTGQKTLTVKYGEYTGTFTVTVYTAETVTLSSSPKQTKYYSHDTEFSTKGAYFTVTANNGSLTRMVEVTPDMVEGFLPSAATLEHMDSPLTQTVKIKYLGKSFDFKVKIQFSAVSLAILRSEELKDVTSENATLEQNENALDALFKYAALTAADKNLVNSDTLQKLLEIGIPYGVKVFEEEAAKFSDTIQLQTVKDEETERLKGKINIIASSYEAVKNDLELLQDKNQLLLTMNETLYKLKEELYLRKIGEQTVGEILCKVFEPGAMDEVTKSFKFLVELHEIFMTAGIPEDWATTEPRLETYGDAVRLAVATIKASDFNAFDGSGTLYSILSTWREKNDYFDIIYAYYYYNDRTNLISTLWEKIYMPGALHELYTLHNFACQEAMDMTSGADTSTFMYYYARTMEVSEQIKSGDNELHRNLYNFFNFDTLIKDYIFFGTKQIGKESINQVAYVYHASSLLGNATYEALLDYFFELFKLSMQDSFSFQDQEAIQAIQELALGMLNSYASFTPTERLAFLSSLHCDYRATTSEQLALSHTVGEDGILTCNNYFSYLLYNTYRKVLSPEAYDVFSRLMEASEMYALRNHTYNSKIYYGFTDSHDVEHLGFLATMEAIIADANKLEEADKALFASLLAELTRAYEIETQEEPRVPTLSAEQTAKFAELKGAIENFYKFYYTAISEEVDAADKFKYYSIAFGAFERANAVAAELRAMENADVMYTLLYVNTEFKISANPDAAGAMATYDYMLDAIGSTFYLTTLRTKTANDSNVLTIYWNNNVASFLNDSYDVFLAVFNNTLDASYADTVKALEDTYLFNYNQIEALKQLGIWEYYEKATAYFSTSDAA